jgi:altronate dehydratase large subunit
MAVPAVQLDEKDNVGTLFADARAGDAIKVLDLRGLGQEPSLGGLSFMDTPGNDLSCTCGLVTGGAQVVLFITGRGTPMGFAFAPVLKITANHLVFETMGENTDLDLSAMLLGDLRIMEAGKIIWEKLVAVANGELTAAERLGHREFGFHRIGPTL